MDQQIMNKIMNMNTEGQAAIMGVSKIVNGQTKLCKISRKTLLIILFDYIKGAMRCMFNTIVCLLFETPMLILARKVRVNKKLAQFIYRRLDYLLFEIKSVCFYIICVVLSLILPEKYMGKILIMVLQDTMDILKKF